MSDAISAVNGDGEWTPVCAIGASAGGVGALQAFFRALDPGIGFAYIVVIHMEPTRPSQLSQILAACTRMPVEEVEDGASLAPDHVYVIPPNRQIRVEGDTLTATPFDEPRGQRAPIDLLFRSLGTGRDNAIAVILSGAGSDGAFGVRAIKEAGGLIFVQDPREAEFPSMPRAAIATGIADYAGAVADVAKRIAQAAADRAELEMLDEESEGEVLRQVVAVLRTRTGHDFSGYKRATVLRRVKRRMQVTRCRSLSGYSRYMRENPEEGQRLFGDLLISVTQFFRDGEAFEKLARTTIPVLLDEMTDDEIRVWSVGCATGEEAYSLAILLLEECGRRQIRPRIQIFATDLDEAALMVGREGVYPPSIEADVSDERLKRFFIREDSHYRVRQEVRDVVLFACHSMVKDPPFLRLNMISCRNLMIYVEREHQRDICAMLHYGLVPGGYLFLGPSESAEGLPELFQQVDREHRLYRARSSTARRLPAVLHIAEHGSHPQRQGFRHRYDPVRDVPEHHRQALEELSPPSVLVDRQNTILNISETAGRFMLPPAGPPTGDLVGMVRPELRLDLQSALHRAFDSGKPTLTFPIITGFNGSRHRVTMHVALQTRAEHEAPRALVLFLDGGPVEDGADETVPHGADQNGEKQIRRLQEELRLSHDQLASSRRDYFSATEELRAANEELQSINEEYRSTSEELESSKEELQSMNEELQTVNDELKRKLDSISQSHNDLQNLVSATDVGTLFLDSVLRIKLFTPRVAEVFNIAAGDIGRSIRDFTHNLAYDGIVADAEDLLRDLVPIEREMAAGRDRWMLMRMRPYRTVEDRIEGVVVSFVDISQRRRVEERLREREQRLSSVLHAARIAAIEWDLENDILHEEGPVAQIVGAVPGLGGASIRQLLDHAYSDDRAVLDATLKNPAAGTDTFDLDFRVVAADDSVSWFALEGRRVADSPRPDRVLAIVQNVTGLKHAEEAQQLLVSELNHRVKNMLAVVQSISYQTRRSHATPEAFDDAFQNRLQALARTHDLLTEKNWAGASLREILVETLPNLSPDESGEGDRFSFDGPRVLLSANSVIAFSLSLHELATNAIKYGALSRPDGHVAISWWPSDAQDTIYFKWAENGGPPVIPPARKGFGTRMVETTLAHELKGRVGLDFAETGLICTMEFPIGDKIRIA